MEVVSFRMVAGFQEAACRDGEPTRMIDLPVGFFALRKVMVTVPAAVSVDFNAGRSAAVAVSGSSPMA